MSAKMRVAVIGSGPQADVVARAFADLGVLHTHLGGQDAPSMMLQLDSAAVAIAVPIEDRAGLATAALKAGKHVLVTGPVAAAVSAAEVVHKEAKNSGALFVSDFASLHDAAFGALREHVRSGALGEVRKVQTSGLDLDESDPPHDVLWSLAPEHVAMALALFGDEPLFVRGSAGGIRSLAGIEECRLDLVFGETKHAHIFVSCTHPFAERRVTVVGDEATAMLEHGAGCEARLLSWRRVSGGDSAHEGFAEPDLLFTATAPPSPVKRLCAHFYEVAVSGSRSTTDAGSRVLRVLSRASDVLFGNNPN